MGTLQSAMLVAVAGEGLAALELHYDLGDDGRFYVRGDRPGRDWHAHGSFASTVRDLRAGRRVSLSVDKQRWRLRGTTTTCHSRAPDDLGLRYSALIVALELFAWLDAALGVHAYVSLFEDLEERPSRRTVQRWLVRLRPEGLALQHQVRAAVLARMEPRPFEALFPGGLSPPATSGRRWRGPHEVSQLHRALAILFGSAISLGCPASSLLAEARRKADSKTLQNG